jgi:hypothetical protein
LEEEREKELEQVYESTLVSQMEKADVNDNMEVDAAGIQTMETLKAGERIMEAIDIGDEERKGWEDYETVRIVPISIAYVLMLLILFMASRRNLKAYRLYHLQETLSWLLWATSPLTGTSLM